MRKKLPPRCQFAQIFFHLGGIRVGVSAFGRGVCRVIFGSRGGVHTPHTPHRAHLWPQNRGWTLNSPEIVIQRPASFRLKSWFKELNRFSSFLWKSSTNIWTRLRTSSWSQISKCTHTLRNVDSIPRVQERLGPLLLCLQTQRDLDKVLITKIYTWTYSSRV